MMVPLSSFLASKLRLAGGLAAAFASAWLSAQTPPAAEGAPKETHSRSVELLRDSSVEESISRKVNVDFESVRIDGEKSNVSLSSLTADQVLAAETTKVPTPDLDADAVGGLLQLTSRRSFEQAVPTFRGSAAIASDSLTRKISPDASVTYGRSVGTERRIGFVITAGANREYDRDHDLDMDWSTSSARGTAFEEFGLGEGTSVFTETTLNSLADWKIAERTFAQFRANYAFIRGEEEHRGFAYRLNDPRQPQSSLSEVKRRYEESTSRESSATLAATLTHTTEAWEADLRVSHTRDDERSPDSREYEFVQKAVGLDFDLTDALFPRVTPRAGAQPDAPERFSLDEFQHEREQERETDTVASLDVKWPSVAGLPTAWLKAGGKFRARHTNQDVTSEVFEGTGVSLDEVLSGYVKDDFYEGKYRLVNSPDGAALRRLFEAQPNRFELDLDDTRNDTDPANYEVRQDVLAAYAMGSLAMGPRTRVLAGVRVEQTKNRFEGYEVIFNDDGRYEATNPLGAKSDYTNWFPGVHVTHSFGPRLDFFASYSQSIRRPDYDQLVPARRTDRSSREISEGNPALRPTLYVNYDAAVDFAYADGGKISLEAFYRDIRDTRLTRRVFLVGGPFDGYERIRPENGGGAELQGFEITWNQELDAWAEKLNGFELEANYLHQRSSQELANRPGEEVMLVETPRHELTLQLSYERGGFYGSVEFGYESAALVAAGSERIADRFVPAGRSWDVSLSYEFSRRWRVFFEAGDITGEIARSYQGHPGLVEGNELRKPQFQLGLKWER